MKRLFLLLLLFGWCTSQSEARNQVRVLLRVQPETKQFWCRYTLTLPANAAPSQILLNLNKQYKILSVRSPRAKQQRIERYLYLVFQDTMQGINLSYATQDRRAKEITVTYKGTLTAKYATDQVMELSGHTAWMPLLPYKDYETVDYKLDVEAPSAYSVISSSPPIRRRAGHYSFEGATCAIELTALVAKQFNQLASASAAPLVTVYKAGRPFIRLDSLLLSESEQIIAFYNQSIGRRDAITRFSIFLPGTDRDAFGLRDNATVITYPDFDIRKQEDHLILAHEISHKWWGYGAYGDYNDWLNEAFATYSSFLYLRAAGDTAAYRQALNTKIKSASGAPAIIGFNKLAYDHATYRRVIYDKGSVVLSALHNRVGDAKFLDILAATAAQKTATTDAFLNLVAQEVGEETRRWLRAELTR
ncbi:M1 family aminopeptidase [uncultured Hymenobacter sp.]|uniref:M1 family aminopeptidase n=1 Tax=uncultured Hymenobacter sp. TaxID=170016 RepID=UPI0035C9E69D